LTKQKAFNIQIAEKKKKKKKKIAVSA